MAKNLKIPQKKRKRKRKSVKIDKFNKVARHKVHTQKSAAFLYSNNEQSVKEIFKKSIYYNIKKYLGIN